MKYVNNELQELLQSYEEFTIEGTVNKNLVSQLARSYDCGLLNLLQTKESIKNHFFSETVGGLIFKLDVFLQFLNNKEFLPDSYTIYKQKIGLANKEEVDLLAKNKEVVLNWPYKDCVLEGGQDSEDRKRSELFFNEILAPTEIERLLSRKALANFKKYPKKDTEFTTNDGDNFLIKGNNLVALYSLKDRFGGKIKSIIIDPPYFFNKIKKDDSFKYNSNFKFSTWLTFMKNRLEIAYDLLADDGVLAFIIGIDGAHQLKLVADEIFKVNQDYRRFVGGITWRKTDNQSNIGDFANVIDYIFIYRKNSSTKLNRLPLSEKAKKEYSYEDTVGKYRRSNILDLTRGKHRYQIITPDGSKLNGPWMITEEQYLILKENGGIHWPSKGQQIPYGKTYLKDSIEKGQISSDFWDATYGTNQRSADEIKLLFDGRIFDFAKPEKLIQNLISLTSDENDYVLDFFMGSATTPAVALKMGRRFIGIEQMDYISTVSVPRLEKVIAGEQGGISPDVDWKGGGSFVYCELKNDAQDFVNKIEIAGTTDQLLELFEIAKKSSFISYRVDPKKLKSVEFKELSFAEQKQLLREIIDNNNLYVNYSDIEDASYSMSTEDIALNRLFYGDGE